MQLSDAFLYLYPIVPIIAIVGYIPQAILLIKVKRVPKTVSVSTWSLWLFSGYINLGYTYFNVGDPLLILTLVINFIAMSFILGLILYKRYRYALAKGVGRPVERLINVYNQSAAFVAAGIININNTKVI